MMHIRRWIALLAALLALAGVAYGQTVTQNGSRTGSPGNAGSQQGMMVGGLGYADSSGQVPAVDPTTHAWQMLEASKDRDYVQLWNMISVTGLASGAADSGDGVAKDVHAYRYLVMYVKVHVQGGAGSVCRIAFQFREHLNNLNDSLSIVPLYGEGQSLMGTISTGADTTNQGHLLAGSATAPWSGEYVLSFSRGREGGSGGAAGTTFYYPAAVGYPLDTLFGRPMRFRFISIRARNLVGPACDVRVTLQGFAK